jgi:hypothetical protein
MRFVGDKACVSVSYTSFYLTVHCMVMRFATSVENTVDVYSLQVIHYYVICLFVNSARVVVLFRDISSVVPTRRFSHSYANHV